MTERLDFIRKLKKERGINEIFTLKEASKQNILQLGKNVKVKDGAVIGTDGFGYERNEKNELEKFPHYGKVIIGDNCDIGMCGIDRGNLTDTVIGNGTKIDNMVQVGHNVKIGKNCLIAGGTVFGGSCEIGDNTFLGINVSVLPHIIIGANCIIGAGSVVTKNISNNSIAYGNPARIVK